MKKKGFTLIELLAVIVILAIIALIATPLVLKYIEKSRKESKVDSAYSFVRNLETEIANYSIKHNGKKYTVTTEEISKLKDTGLNTEVKGENPEDGKVCISNVGQVEKGVFKYGKYYVSYDGKKGSISDSDTYDNFSCSSNVAGDNNIEIPQPTKNFEVTYTQKLTFFNGMMVSKSDFKETPVVGENISAILKFNDQSTQEIILEFFDPNSNGSNAAWRWIEEFDGMEIGIYMYDIPNNDYYIFNFDTYDSDYSKTFENLYSVTLLGNEVKHYIIEWNEYVTDATIFNEPDNLDGKSLILTFDDGSQREVILNECFLLEGDNGSFANFNDNEIKMSPDNVIMYYASDGELYFGVYGVEGNIKTITTNDNGVMTTYNIIK